MVGGDHEKQRFGHDDGADGEIRFTDGQPGGRHVHRAVAERAEGVREDDLLNAQGDLGVPAAEQVEQVRVVVCLGTVQAESQRARRASGGSGGRAGAVEYPLVARAEIAPQLCADGGQLDLAAAPGEEGRPDPAFLLGDRLADSRRRHVQPVRGPAEVQLLGQRQEDLDVP